MTYVQIPKDLALSRKPKIPLSRVELHVHLDGAIRRSTAYELKVKQKQNEGSSLCETYINHKAAIRILEPENLGKFLSKFQHFAPSFAGDLEAIKRIALEFCEDSAKNGVLYVEARFSPHLMAKDEVKAEHVVRTVCDTFKEAEGIYGVKARAILCCIIGLPAEIAEEVLELCQRFKDEGVVGIDIAGDEASIVGEMYNEREKQVFSEARRLGIHRTIHAGEDGPSEHVTSALDVMGAERIGHGYHALDDPAVYARCRKDNIHFEVCPTSSIMTGAVSAGDAASLKHPLIRFAQDNVNFSLNTDDPTVTGTYLQQEIELVRSWGLTETHITRAMFNGARSSFLPEHEKKDLLKALRKVYSVDID